jgi:hypothetical protein
MTSVRRISLVGKHKRAQSGGVVPSSPALSGGGFFNRSGGGGKGADPPPLPYSSHPSRIRQVSCPLRLPEESGRLLVCISISNYSAIQICILRRGRSFLILRIVARRAQCILRRWCLEALDLFLDRIRGAQVWGWVEVYSEHRLERLGSGPSRRRGDRKMGGGNSKEAELAQGRLHVDLWLRRSDRVWISCLVPRKRITTH